MINRELFNRLDKLSDYSDNNIELFEKITNNYQISRIE